MCDRLKSTAGLAVLVLAATLVTGGIGQAAATVEIYVSPAGNDAHSGSRPDAVPGGNDGPLATVSHARDVARRRRAEAGGNRPAVTVWLHGGTYYLDQTLTFSSEDSGTVEAPVAWRAMPGEEPVISGGRPILGWTETQLNGQTIWRASLPADAGPAEIRELWCGDVRLARCRWPRQGTLAVAHLAADAQQPELGSGVSAFGYSAADEPPADVASVAGAEAIVCSLWADSHLPLTGIDRAGRLWQAAAPTTLRSHGRRSLLDRKPGRGPARPRQLLVRYCHAYDLSHSAGGSRSESDRDCRPAARSVDAAGGRSRAAAAGRIFVVHGAAVLARRVVFRSCRGDAAPHRFWASGLRRARRRRGRVRMPLPVDRLPLQPLGQLWAGTGARLPRQRSAAVPVHRPGGGRNQTGRNGDPLRRVRPDGRQPRLRLPGGRRRQPVSRLRRRMGRPGP